jgi:hypothetical protein
VSYKPSSLFRLIEELNRNVFLPHIQRPFVWEEDQMLRLFDSLMRNYPQSMLRSKLGLLSADINHLGNLRFMGATDNIRKRAELPADYFARMKSGGMDVTKHLLLPDYAADPKKLAFDITAYKEFRDGRFERMWDILSSTTNPEVAWTPCL